MTNTTGAQFAAASSVVDSNPVPSHCVEGLLRPSEILAGSRTNPR